MTETLPLNVMQMYAIATGDKKLKNNVTMFKQLSDKMFGMQKIFYHFINQMWRF